MINRIELYIRTQWSAHDARTIETDLSEAGRAIFGAIAVRIIGVTWYRSEKSGSVNPIPINLDQLTKGVGWMRKKLIEGQVMHRLVLANGLGESAQAGVSGTIFEGSPNPSQVVVSLPEPPVLFAAGLEFRDVLSMAEDYARALHGVAVVGSSDLFASANYYGLKTGEGAAYAAFWGAKRVRGDPLFKRLEERKIEAPYSRVACTSWSDLSVPDAGAIEAVQELLSRS